MAKSKIIGNINNLTKTHPALLNEWVYDKNNEIGILPTNVTAGSNKKAWWKCSEGHEWSAMIKQRTTGTGCPVCSKAKLSSIKISLSETHSALLNEWNYDKNNELGILPTNVTAGSNKKAWWKCSEGHEWSAMIKQRTNGTGCPVCSKAKLSSTNIPLSETHPALLNERNYVKNETYKRRK